MKWTKYEAKNIKNRWQGTIQMYKRSLSQEDCTHDIKLAKVYLKR